MSNKNITELLCSIINDTDSTSIREMAHLALLKYRMELAERAAEQEMYIKRPPSPFDENHSDWDGKRVHKIVDEDCEMCTKHYWDGGSELDFTCTFCGIRFEREPDETGWCYHCEGGETPGIKEEHERLDILEALDEEERMERWEAEQENSQPTFAVEKEQFIKFIKNQLRKVDDFYGKENKKREANKIFEYIGEHPRVFNQFTSKFHRFREVVWDKLMEFRENNDYTDEETQHYVNKLFPGRKLP